MVFEREVAGLRCGEVLADLSDYLDGELEPGRRALLDAHLQGCDVCERFGSAFTIAILALRQGGPGVLAEDSISYERLNERLAKTTGKGPG